MAIRLKLEDVHYRYAGVAASPTDVLKGISLELGANECTAIVGPSGSGKTTLIQHFTGLLRPTKGSVTFNGQDIWARSFRQSELRRRIGLVFQFPEAQLFEETVEKDVAFGPKNFGLPAAEIHQRVTEALAAVDLSPDFGPRSPFRISEGEKRRVAVAGVLAMRPEMLVFDEPTAGLDPGAVRRFTGIIRRLLDAGTAVVVVTHNMDFVAEIADRVLVLRQGRMLFAGTPYELFQDQTLIEQADLELPTVVQALREHGDWAAQTRDVLTFAQLVRRINELRNHAG